MSEEGDHPKLLVCWQKSSLPQEPSRTDFSTALVDFINCNYTLGNVSFVPAYRSLSHLETGKT